MKLWQKNQLKRINILEGSVSSGKTWISLVLWAFWVKTMPADSLYMMCAKSLTALKRNCLLPLSELVGENNFNFSMTRKEGELFGRKILLEGANDARAESKIRGLTLQGAYCDELTQFPQDFFTMLLSRNRKNNAKIFATTNPDSPAHWLKTKYIDRQEELSLLDIKFTIGDNTTLDPEYVKNIKLEYTGIFYERFILGLWVLAEGLVYGNIFDKSRHVIQNYIPTSNAQFYVSCDYGTLNPCSMGLWALENDKAVRLKEYYYDGRRKSVQKTDEEYYTELEKLAKGCNIQHVIVDPSAASFITTIKKHGKFSVRKARNDVLNGIRTTMNFLNNDKIFICENCRDTIREFGLYRWDEKCGKDAVIKENDHAMDDIRYFCYNVLRRKFTGEEGKL